ncbi:hypothetical protein D047_5100B, partial [Vibrio parahaemolyticus VPTS-2010_2]
RMSD